MVTNCRLLSFSDRRGPLLTMLLPLMLCTIQFASGSPITPMNNVPILPGLSFDQYLVDLREVSPTDEVFGYFGFRNTGHVPLTIQRLEPSCGCLQPRLSKSILQPGEAGEFRLRIKTALQQPGKKEFSVKVHYTDTETRVREVFLRVVFPEQQIYVRPMSVTFHQYGTSPIEQDIIVTDLREFSADVLGAESTSPFVEASVLGSSKTADGARQHRIHLTISGAVPGGRHLGSIKIFTNDDTFYEINVPMQIFGPGRNGSNLRMASPGLIGPSLR